MFTKTTIKFRLNLVLGILVALVATVGVVGLYGFHESNNALGRVYQDRLVPSQQLGKILDTWYAVRRSMGGIFENTINTGRKRVDENQGRTACAICAIVQP